MTDFNKIKGVDPGGNTVTKGDALLVHPNAPPPPPTPAKPAPSSNTPSNNSSSTTTSSKNGK